MTKEEVLAALRSEGAATSDESTFVVIKTDNTLPVLTGTPSSDGSSSLPYKASGGEAEGAQP